MLEVETGTKQFGGKGSLDGNICVIHWGWAGVLFNRCSAADLEMRSGINSGGAEGEVKNWSQPTCFPGRNVNFLLLAQGPLMFNSLTSSHLLIQQLTQDSHQIF